jgi:hypothetical protein
MRKSTTTKGRASDGVLALKLFDQTVGPSWAAWRSWLCAVLGLEMSESEAAIFRACTGRTTLPTAPCREVWTVAGRRAGKSRMAAFVTVFMAACRTYTLAPGERGIVPVISPSRPQSRIIFDYALAMLQAFPAADTLIARQTQDTIELATGTRIQIQSASFRTPRGYSNVGCVPDEICFWRDADSNANPDTEIIRALRPSLAGVPGSLLCAISSPYAQRGELFKMYEKHYGRDDSDILIWQSDTRTLNPTIPQKLIDQAMEDDPAAASAEWLGQWRSDLESLFAREALADVVIPSRHELPPVPGVAYVGFTDPSGGSADAFSLAIAHRDPAGVPVLDLVREVRPPFSPEGVTADFARELKRYGVGVVTGDRYAGEWPREAFRKLGIAYEPSELTRSELYLELLAPINSGSVELLDNARLIGQLAGLERRVGRSGKDAVDHRPGSHDDLANAAAGALVHAVRSMGLATLPDTFRSCYRAVSMKFDIESCYIFGGAFPGMNDICCGGCIGHTYVRAARKAHEARTGEAIPLLQFYRERLDWKAHPFVERVRHAGWMLAEHGI